MQKSLRMVSLLCVALICALPLCADGVEAALTKELDRMASAYYFPTLSASFGTFTYAYSGLPSPFARWLEERLADAATKSSRVRIVNCAAQAAMDPAFRKVYADLFSVQDVGALLYGRYFDEGKFVRARLELTGFSDGVLIGTAELLIPRSAVPSAVAVDPAKAALLAAADLSGVVTGEGGGLRVSVSTDRGQGAVYREGEYMRLLITTNQDAWIKVYHIDSGGTAQLVWPNRFGGSGRIAASEVLTIPSAADAFAFRLTPPFGTEFIKVVASTQPFAVYEADFSDLTGGARGAISRGIAVTKAAPGAAAQAVRAEALARYLILPRE